jgi:hypothetical protein
MKAATITEDDLRTLRQSTSKTKRLAVLWALLLFIVLLVVTGVLNLYLCRRYAAQAGFNMSGIVRNWFSGTDLTAQYSGTYITAQERWVIGITQFALAGFVALAVTLERRVAKRNARILRFIEETEANRPLH